MIHPKPFTSSQEEIFLGKTIPMLFLETTNQKPERVAFRFKNLGIYQGVTWQEYKDHVELFSLGLVELGLKKGDRIAIMGDPCPEWLYADLAVQCGGAISFGIYSTCSPEEVRYQVETAGAKFFIAEDQEYVDKILPFADQFPDLLKIIVIDTRAMFTYKDPRLISFSEVEEMGRKRRGKSPDQFEGLIRETHPEDTAFFVFTSGTTGPPKPAMLSHQNILRAFVYAFSDVFPELWSHEHRAISHLSLAHIFERSVSIYFPLLYDLVPHIGEEVEYLQETLYEVQPTFFHGVPRIWEKMAGQIIVGIESSSKLKKMTFRLGMRINRSYIQKVWDGEKISLKWRLLHWIAYQIVFRQILNKLGLIKAKYVISTGAPLPPQIQSLWQTWGVDLVNLYGSTEASGIISSQHPGFPKPGDLGKPTSINKVKLAEDGELLVGGPGVFQGYWNNEELTNETIKDGWVYMGEVFEYNEKGHLKMIDRKKDIMVTAGGKNITPTEIENAIKASPYISEVVVFADGRKFPSALIEIDFNTVAEWARRNKVLYTGFTSLANHSKTYELIAEEVEKGNQLLSRVERVKKFRIIPKELDPEEGDTTPTRKIKRKLIYEMFKDLVEEMYRSKEEEVIEAETEVFLKKERRTKS
jgi:long-chain acyl-CoA synthetase